MIHRFSGRYLLRILPTACLFFTSFPNVAGAQQSDKENDLLQRVLRQNQAAYYEVLSAPLYVDFSWNTQSDVDAIPLPTPGVIPGGHRKSTGRSRLWRQGHRFHQDLDLVHRWDDGRKSDESQILVLGDTYFTRYRKTTHLLEVYHFENRNSLYPPVSSMVKSYPQPDILQFGFKACTSILADNFQRSQSFSPPAFSWHVSRENISNRPAFVVQMQVLDDDAPWLKEEAIIDPASGYLIGGYRWLDSAGELRWKTETTFQELKEGRWFPKTATLFRQERNETAEYTVNEVRIGDPVPHSQFTLEAMEFDPETTMMREYTRSGRAKTERGYWGGQWVPLHQMPPDRVAALERIRQDGIARQKSNGKSK